MNSKKQMRRRTALGRRAHDAARWTAYGNQITNPKKKAHAFAKAALAEQECMTLRRHLGIMGG